MTDAALAAIRPEMVTELRKLAEKATPGPWKIGRMGDLKMTHVVDFGEPPKAPYMCLYEGHPDTVNMRGLAPRGVCHSDDGSSENNAAYIAAVSPDVVLAFLARIEALEAENARLKADRLYIVGCNDGYDAAMEQAAEFCDGAEASWRETSDKAHDLDHNEAMGWSTAANAKADTCAGLASTIRTASVHPLIRGVGLCMLDGKDAAARAALTQSGGQTDAGD